MSREAEQLKKNWNVDEIGIIKDHGMFWGQYYYLPYYYKLIMDGQADREYIDPLGVLVWVLDLIDTDFELFPELKGYTQLHVWESSQEFVCGFLV